MPRFRVITHVTATVREVWEVEAEDEQAAFDEDWTEREHIRDDTLGDEENRVVIEVERI